jgi:integrase
VIRQLHIAQGEEDPYIGTMGKLEQVLRGIKSSQAKKGVKKVPRLPITPTILLALKGSWEREGPIRDKAMLWAASTLCFFGFLRPGEVCVPPGGAFDEGAHLTIRDVQVDNLRNPQSIQIRIKASKTDPFRQRVFVYVGRTNHRPICPVSALLAYLVLRGNKPGPLFMFGDGSPLARPWLMTEIRRALSAAGLDPKPYSGHSFRSGAATTAAKQGVEDSTIKMLGRWKSSAYQLYMMTPREQLAKISAKLVASVPHHSHS